MINRIKKIVFKTMYICIIMYLLTFLPSLFGYKPLVVISGSMQPNLKVGSIIYYHNVDIDSFKKGDVLVFKTNKHIISHRIVNISEDGFITKGDANNQIDENQVFKEQVMGKGTDWCIPFLGYYSDYIYNHKYLIYICLVILTVDLYNDYRKKNMKKVGMTNEKNI